MSCDDVEVTEEDFSLTVVDNSTIVEILESDTQVEVNEDSLSLTVVEDSYTIEVVSCSQGPQGPQGPPGVAQATVFVFGSPASVWPLPHNFGRYPIVQTYSLLGEWMPTSVLSSDTNNSSAVYAIPTTGFAVLI